MAILSAKNFFENSCTQMSRMRSFLSTLEKPMVSDDSMNFVVQRIFIENSCTQKSLIFVVLRNKEIIRFLVQEMQGISLNHRFLALKCQE